MIDARQEVGVREVYRLSFDSVLPLLGALAVAVGVLTAQRVDPPPADRNGSPSAGR